MKGCPVGTCAPSPLCLNSTSLSLDSFLLSLMSAITHRPFQALLDSGSSHSFVDEMFVHHNKLTLAYLMEPIPLQLFNGSSTSSIVSKTWMPMTMLTGETHETEFFVMKLDKGYSIVLGYDWLQQHNLAINWVETKVFADVFSDKKANTLPPHWPYDLQINTEGDSKPFYSPIYSLSQLELTALCKFLEENTRNGFIHPSRSPWGSPVLFIKKKDGSLCLCIDYQALNKVTQKDWYPLPLITDLLDSLGPGRIYTKIDLKHAYHLVRIAEGDEPKMAF